MSLPCLVLQIALVQKLLDPGNGADLAGGGGGGNSERTPFVPHRTPGIPYGQKRDRPLGLHPIEYLVD